MEAALIPDALLLWQSPLGASRIEVAYPAAASGSSSLSSEDLPLYSFSLLRKVRMLMSSTRAA